jgi:hypothetical protein
MTDNNTKTFEEMEEKLEEMEHVNEVGDIGTALLAQVRNPSGTATFGGVTRDGWAVTNIDQYEMGGCTWRNITFAPISEVNAALDVEG